MGSFSTPCHTEKLHAFPAGADRPPRAPLARSLPHPEPAVQHQRLRLFASPSFHRRAMVNRGHSPPEQGPEFVLPQHPFQFLEREEGDEGAQTSRDTRRAIHTGPCSRCPRSLPAGLSRASSPRTVSSSTLKTPTHTLNATVR